MSGQKPHEASDDHRVLSGKRKTPRRRRSIGVRCVGADGRAFACRTVDISAGGMLIQITDDAFIPLDQPVDIFPFATRVSEVFPEGMDVVFGDGAVTLRATVVRLVAEPGQQPLLQLGCAFESGLSDVVCRLLGLESGVDETTEPPACVRVDAPPTEKSGRGAPDRGGDRSKSASRSK